MKNYAPYVTIVVAWTWAGVLILAKPDPRPQPLVQLTAFRTHEDFLAAAAEAGCAPQSWEYEAGLTGEVVFGQKYLGMEWSKQPGTNVCCAISGRKDYYCASDEDPSLQGPTFGFGIRPTARITECEISDGGVVWKASWY